MLIVIVSFTPHQERRAEFLNAVVHNAKISIEQEAGCLCFDVCIREDDPEILLYEKYTDTHAFDDVHLKSEHFVEFNELTSSMVVDKKVTRYHLA